MDIPHMGQITVQAIIYKQMPNNQYDPKAVWHDSFAVTFTFDNEKECIESIKKKIQEWKDAKH